MENQPTPNVPAASIPAAVDNVFTDDIVRELKNLEAKTGVRFSKIEEDYKTNFSKLDTKISLPMRRSYALMQVKAETANLGDNPLVDYELIALGAQETPKSVRLICYTMMMKKGQNGENIGDPRDLFDPPNGKLGIPTVAVFYPGSGKEQVEKLTSFSWWNANLSVTGTGVSQREVTATSYTNFTPINKPEVTPDQLEAWKNKTFPLLTLNDLKRVPTKLLPARKEGARQYQDSLDLRRFVGVVKRAAMNTGKGGIFCSYTVLDNSLNENEILNIKDENGKVVKYGGIQVSVSESLFKSLNLAEESLIEVIGTVQMKCQHCKGRGNVDGVICQPCGGKGLDNVNGQLSINAVAIIPIVKKERKTPISQRAPTPAAGIQSTSLASLAGNQPASPTYIG